MSIFSKLFGQKKSETAKETVNDPPVFDNPTEQEINFDKLPDEQDQKKERKGFSHDSEPKDIPEAIRFIVETQGQNYLTTRGFINILNDFRLLKDIPAAKNILLGMLDGGYIQNILASHNWVIDARAICNQYVNEFGTKQELVSFIIDSIGFGLGFSDTKPSYNSNGQTAPSVSPSESKRQETSDIIVEPINANSVQLEPYDPKRDLENYHYPTLDLLTKYVDDCKPFIDISEQTANKNRIVDVLRNFGIEISTIKATVGPTITLYELTLAPGERISKIRNLDEDIALSLSAFGVRVIAPIPGKGTVGIEIPNVKLAVVSLESLLNSKKFQETTMELPCAIGRTITNEVFMFDLTKAPHVLVGGATGQGKTMMLNAIITSLLYKKHPAELKLVLIDPKKVEFNSYSKIKNHFLAYSPEFYNDDPIISETKEAIRTLNSLIKEMDTRYDLLKMAQVRNIQEYNNKFINRQLNPEHGHRYMQYIVVIIDEYGDLIMSAGKEIELPIARLAQVARAIGIHLVIATQRPTKNIITGPIKANFPTRIAFRVSTMMDSKTIIDDSGAEQLIGRGDMLYLNGNSPLRIQGALVDVQDIERISNFIALQQGYMSPYELIDPDEENSDDYSNRDIDMQHLDPLFEDAARLIVREQSGSTSLIQRKFAIGYNRAGRLMGQLEKAGVVGQAHGSAPRKVLITDERSLERLLSRNSFSGNIDLQHLDPLFEEAARLIVMSQSGSTALIQRKFAIGYNRAGRLMDQLEKAGIVGAAHGSKPREVLILDLRSLENLLTQLR